MEGDAPPPRWRGLAAHVHWLIPLLAAWVWFCTLQATSFDRVRLLHNVEGYALAVYNQLMWTFSHTGHFAQTIHFGYDDNWMWSGHRALFLPIVGKLYGLSPDPVWLCRIQILFLTVGALPAYALGRLSVGGVLGGWVGLVAYCLYPPLMVIALGDYQDVVLGVPFLIAAMVMSRRGSNVGFVLFAALTCFAREEWLAMIPLIGLSVPGGLKQRAAWVLKGVGVSAAMAGVLWLVGVDAPAQAHDNPMASHITDLLTWPPPITRTWADFSGFYVEFLKPIHGLSLLAPATLLPAFGPLFFHLTAPADGGVDTHFAHHIHHMAPVAAWLIAATIDGAGHVARGLRWGLSRVGGRVARPAEAVILTLLFVGMAAGSAAHAKPWLKTFGIVPQATMSVRLSPPSAPEWALAAKAPRGAAIATDVAASLIIASRLKAYTYDESFRDKAPRAGLRAVEYLMVNKRDTAWVALAEAWPGAQLLGETRSYQLFHLPAEGADAFPPGPIAPKGALNHGHHGGGDPGAPPREHSQPPGMR